MSDPPRWRDGAEDLPADLRAAWKSAPRPAAMPPEARAQLASFARSVAQTPAGSAPWVQASGLKVGLALVLVAAGAGLLAHAAQPVVPVAVHPALARAPALASALLHVREPATIAPVPVPVAVAAEQPSPRAVVAVSERSDHPLPVRAVRLSIASRGARVDARGPGAPVPVVAVREPACPVDPSAGEPSIVRAAAAALSVDPALTLRCLTGLGEPGASASLGEERGYLRFEALRRLGRVEPAQAEAQRIVREHPDSIYAPRVQRWLDAPR